MRFLILLSTILSGTLASGCDAFEEQAPIVSGRIVDAFTGEPLRGGFEATVSVLASSNTALLNPGLLGSTVADADGLFRVESQWRDGYTINPRVTVGSSGRIEGPNPSGLPDSILAILPARFPPYEKVEIPVRRGTSDLGTIEMVPQGVMTVATTFDRLYEEGERVVVRFETASGWDANATMDASTTTPSRAYFSLPAGESVELSWVYVAAEREEVLGTRQVRIPLFEEVIVPVEIVLPER